MVKGLIESNDDTLNVNVDSAAFQLKSRSSAQVQTQTGRVLNVTVDSASRVVKVAIKPGLLAQEERQERLNRSMRLGFVPPSRNTAR